MIDYILGGYICNECGLEKVILEGCIVPKGWFKLDFYEKDYVTNYNEIRKNEKHFCSQNCLAEYVNKNLTE